MRIAIVTVGTKVSALEETRGLLASACQLAAAADTEIWLLGGADKIESEELGGLDCRRVIWCAGLDSGFAEGYLPALLALYEERQPELVLFAAGILENEAAVRLGLHLGCGSLVGASGIRMENDAIFAEKPVYSMNLQGTFLISQRPAILSLTPVPPEPEEKPERQKPEIILRADLLPRQIEWLSDVEEEITQEEDSIRTAKTVLVAGRGMGGQENIPRLEELARLLDGQVGGTRPVALDGWVPLDQMIGVSASLLSPETCIVFGASGAVAFMAGVEKSRLLVAVNSDPNALIFGACDVGVVDDCKELADALATLLEGKGVGR